MWHFFSGQNKLLPMATFFRCRFSPIPEADTSLNHDRWTRAKEISAVEVLKQIPKWAR